MLRLLGLMGLLWVYILHMTLASPYQVAEARGSLRKRLADNDPSTSSSGKPPRLVRRVQPTDSGWWPVEALPRPRRRSQPLTWLKNKFRGSSVKEESASTEPAEAATPKQGVKMREWTDEPRQSRRRLLSFSSRRHVTSSSEQERSVGSGALAPLDEHRPAHDTEQRRTNGPAIEDQSFRTPERKRGLSLGSRLPNPRSLRKPFFQARLFSNSLDRDRHAHRPGEEDKELHSESMKGHSSHSSHTSQKAGRAVASAPNTPLKGPFKWEAAPAANVAPLDIFSGPMSLANASPPKSPPKSPSRTPYSYWSRRRDLSDNDLSTISSSKISQKDEPRLSSPPLDAYSQRNSRGSSGENRPMPPLFLRPPKGFDTHLSTADFENPALFSDQSFGSDSAIRTHSAFRASHRPPPFPPGPGGGSFGDLGALPPANAGELSLRVSPQHSGSAAALANGVSVGGGGKGGAQLTSGATQQLLLGVHGPAGTGTTDGSSTAGAGHTGHTFDTLQDWSFLRHPHGSETPSSFSFAVSRRGSEPGGAGDEAGGHVA